MIMISIYLLNCFVLPVREQYIVGFFKASMRYGLLQNVVLRSTNDEIKIDKPMLS